MVMILFISSIALWIVVLVNTALIVGVIRVVSDRRELDAARRHGDGEQVPAFSINTESGTTISNQSLLGQTSGLLFVSPECPTCMASINQLKILNSRVERELVVVCQSTRGRCKPIAEELSGKYPVAIDERGELGLLFAIETNPTAVMMSATGTIERYGHPIGKEELHALLNGD